MSVIYLGTLPDNTRLTSTANVSKSRFPVSQTDLPKSCLRWFGWRPSGLAADPGLKESIALLISLLEAVLGWCIPSSEGRGRLRSDGAGGCFSCKAVKVSEENTARPFDEQTSLTAPLMSRSMNSISTRLCNAFSWLVDCLQTLDDSLGESSCKPVHVMYSSTWILILVARVESGLFCRDLSG